MPTCPFCGLIFQEGEQLDRHIAIARAHNNPSKGAVSDPINPAHYHGDYVMRIIEDFKLDFCRGTVLKYLLRAGKKAGAAESEDLKKARWYLDRAIARAVESTGQTEVWNQSSQQ